MRNSHKDQSGYSYIAKLVTALLIMLGSQPCWSLDSETLNTVTFYNGQGSDTNLTSIPGNLISGDLKKEKSYFTGFGFTRKVGQLGSSFTAMDTSGFSNVQHGYVLQALKHRGLQSNGEIGAGYFLKTPDAEMGDIKLNFSVATGLSYALGEPTYEDGSESNPDKRYRLQLLMLYEVEMRHRALNNLSLVAGVHHRSGVYGLIAPKRVGSNFYNIGIRYNF